MLPHTHEKLKHQPSEADIAKLRALIAQIWYGQSTRCASCLAWTNRTKIGRTALFLPKDNSETVAYAVCQRCWTQSQRNAAAQSAFVERCEKYLIGGAK